MKQKLFMLMRLFLCCACIFIFIYLLVFLWGWKLIGTGDPVLTEIVVSVVLGAIFYVLLECCLSLHKRIDELENRLDVLEKLRKTKRK